MFILKNSYDDYLGTRDSDHPPKKIMYWETERAVTQKNPQWDPWIPVTNYKYYYGQKKLFRNIVTVKFETIKTISDR